MESLFYNFAETRETAVGIIWHYLNQVSLESEPDMQWPVRQLGFFFFSVAALTTAWYAAVEL